MSQPASESTALARYADTYVAKKKFFTFLGNAFRLFGPDGELAFFVKQKAFKLKEEITVFADEAQSDPVLAIKARNILDTSATYDVTDLKTDQKVGALQRQGLKSIFRDEWMLLDADDAMLGKVQEDSGLLALVRRFLLKIIPQTFKVTIDGDEVGSISQRFNPFLLTYDVDFSADRDQKVDRRLVVATVVLLLAIEGRQQ